jgi:hypothetical protein
MAVEVAAGLKLLAATNCTGEATLAFGPGEQICTVPAAAVH